MTSVNFCYWLQGFFEINEANNDKTPYPITKEQVECIQKHLNMVFIHEIDPSFPQEQQVSLNNAHQGIHLKPEKPNFPLTLPRHLYQSVEDDNYDNQQIMC